MRLSDFIYVIQADHEKNFNFSKKTILNNNQFAKIIELQAFTNGPAESAYLGSLNIDDNEPILINDCDHYFNSPSQMKEIRNCFNNENLIVLTYTKPINSQPNWSYLRLDQKERGRSRRVLEIAEKDAKMSILGNGVVGSYYFSSKKLFRDLYLQIKSNYSESELYISHIIRQALKQNIEVIACKSLFGYPLGTENDISEFCELTKNSSRYFPTGDSYFFDLDGVLVEHDSGLHSRDGNFSKIKPIGINFEFVNELYRKGNEIVLTTSRANSTRNSLVSQLNENGLLFDTLITGILDGKRILINDTKPKKPYYDTAFAINVQRNSEILIEELSQHDGKTILEDLTGGSSAFTLKLKKNEYPNNLIRKGLYKNSATHSDLKQLETQINWFELARQYIPNNLPQIYSTYDSKQLIYYEMEYIRDSIKISEFIGSGIKNTNSIETKIEQLTTALNSLYDQTALINRDVNFNKIRNEYFLNEKTIPGILSLFKDSRYQHLNLENRKMLRINDKNFSNPFLELRNSKIDLFQNNNLGFLCDVECLIHGDLTLENILTTPDEVFLIDPLSNFMDPSHLRGNIDNLYRANLTYDFLKLLQSLKCGYENWSSIDNCANIDSEGQFYFEFNLVNENLGVIEKIKPLYSNYGINVTDENINLLSALILYRLVPYRLKKNPNSAIFAFCLATSLLEELK